MVEGVSRLKSFFFFFFFFFLISSVRFEALEGFGLM